MRRGLRDTARRAAWWTGALAIAALAGCATAGSGDDTSGVDGSTPKVDGATPKDGAVGCPTGRTGPGCASCAAGFHLCGGDCVQDNANVPEKGCAQGCSGACAPPSHSSSKCSAQGACDWVCDATFDKTDAGCACPMGQIACQSGCAACCQNSDCAPHVLCNGGSCGGCEPGWGDCNNNPADGCETSLSVDGNCGSCGNSCCGSFCGCGFLGVGGKSCKPNGQSYSCQC